MWKKAKDMAQNLKRTEGSASVRTCSASVEKMEGGGWFRA